MDSVVHFEIPVDDMKRAKEFYTEVFDWQLDDMPGTEYVMAYTAPVDENRMPTKPGAINGGLTPRTTKETKFMNYIGVDSIDEYLRMIEKHRGEVVLAKTPMGEWGSYAQFKDPEGNVIGLWENAQAS
ncbi:MAG: VOC family protein [Corynebacteriales bacterium]|nr:VOC family protein [Mycobacteriales bacterium]